MPTVDDPAGLTDPLEALRELKELAGSGPDPEATRRQHAKGKLTAHERIGLLLDKGSFTEVEPLRRHRASGFGLETKRPHGDGVVTGFGTVEGRTVFVYAADFRIFGGALGEAHAQKIHKLMDMAIAAGAPLVSLNDGAGARIQEGVSALAGYGGIFQRNTKASGVIPQISVMLGPCAGHAAYAPALTDFVFVVRHISQMFITGPDVVRAVTGEDVSMDELGGAQVHGGVSGVAHFVCDNEEDCLAEVRQLLSMLPANNRDLPPAIPRPDLTQERAERLAGLVPKDGNRAYDVGEVIAEIVDDGDYLQVHAAWAANLVCALARLDGHVVGIVANQPSVFAGVLDIKASEKGARFVQFCDAFNIPLLTLVDVPGFLPGVGQEHEGIIRRGAKLLYAYCNATVPRISVVLQGIRWRVHRDGLAFNPGGHHACLTGQRDRRHGGGGGRRRHLPPGDRRVGRPCRHLGAEGGPVSRGTGAPVLRGGTWARRRRDRPPGHPHVADPLLCDAAQQARRSAAPQARQPAAMSAPELFARVDKGELDPVELVVLVAVLVRRAHQGAAADESGTVRRRHAHW